MSASQAGRRGFDPRLPLNFLIHLNRFVFNLRIYQSIRLTFFITKLKSFGFTVLVLALLLSACSRAVQSPPVNAEFHYNRGIDFLQKKDLDEAEMEFRYALELDHKFAPAHMGMAVLNYNNKDYSVAEYYINEALKFKENWPDAYLLKGKIFFGKERYVEALKFFDLAEQAYHNGNGKKRKSFMADVHLYCGLSFMHLAEFGKAGEELRLSLHYEPGNRSVKEAVNELLNLKNLIAAVPVSMRGIMLKQSITRGEWAALLITGLSDKCLSSLSVSIHQSEKNPYDINESTADHAKILSAVRLNLVNIYPDGEFKPDLNLSWAEVVISVKNIIKGCALSIMLSRKTDSPFSDLDPRHPLFESAVQAASLGVFSNTSHDSFRLADPVNGLDALHVIVNINKILKSRE
jgi:Tfp pilus assembly protein PilF